MKLFQDIVNKFKPALNGLIYAFYDKSVRKHFVIAMTVIVTTLFLNFNLYEWLYVIVACGLIISLEIINSIIEQIIDMHYATYHIFAGKIKDLSASFVLIMSIAVAIGYILILKHKFL